MFHYYHVGYVDFLPLLKKLRFCLFVFLFLEFVCLKQKFHLESWQIPFFCWIWWLLHRSSLTCNWNCMQKWGRVLAQEISVKEMDLRGTYRLQVCIENMDFTAALCQIFFMRYILGNVMFVLYKNIYFLEQDLFSRRYLLHGEKILRHGYMFIQHSVILFLEPRKILCLT